MVVMTSEYYFSQLPFSCIALLFRHNFNSCTTSLVMDFTGIREDILMDVCQEHFQGNSKTDAPESTTSYRS